ncbi:Dyp-type peroxidase [Aeromicrobium wangtongii]|uniref:Dyp-type peroxidase n=1 Tax=Aeromicrobium wangtongii TaxID=2969247 RepID=A0ABY5ME91_9ACTN|nr:Dyp-type peroxidase [Aeromicrobium wangtongii]MCD9197859.1 Dyp-type peroxidase [Aeromicrobium wangtongii]UUP15340.1 Dyp-type peroxidase [Aeromicrobium wangtongii]
MSERPRRLSRRTLLASGAAGAAGLAVGAAGASAVGKDPDSQDLGRSTVPFRGAHQAGVTTAPQTHATFVAFDLRDDVDADGLRRLLRIWTDDIERLMSGRPGLTDTEPELASRPDRLTVTVGVGAKVVEVAGAEVPGWLGPLPEFVIDRLESRWSGGDLILQVCSDDELSVSHAVRVLTKEARTFVAVRWVQRGFRGPVKGPDLPRNLMGQVDGTAAPAASEHDRLVWVGDGSRQLFGAQPAWLEGGTTMVVRRIAMDLDTWDELDRPSRERTIGRRLKDGRPLTGGSITDDPDLEARDSNGLEVIDPFAHVRRARTEDRTQQFLRRPYNYDDPPASGDLTNAGLVFVTFQADVDRQFIPIQARLAELDLLNQWTTPIGSAVFAILPGTGAGGFLGEALFS